LTPAHGVEAGAMAPTGAVSGPGPTGTGPALFPLGAAPRLCGFKSVRRIGGRSSARQTSRPSAPPAKPAVLQHGATASTNLNKWHKNLGTDSERFGKSNHYPLLLGTTCMARLGSQSDCHLEPTGPWSFLSSHRLHASLTSNSTIFLGSCKPATKHSKLHHTHYCTQNCTIRIVWLIVN
jgi:hypothetical protein